MEKNNNNVLGGFETILDNFIPKTNEETKLNDLKQDIDSSSEPTDKNVIEDPVIAKMRKDGNVDNDDVDENPDDQIDEDPIEPAESKSSKTKNIQEPKQVDDDDESETEMITNFFDAMSEKLGWDEIDEESKPKDVESLLNYFSDIIEQESKPQYASEEIEALDNYVKQGGDLTKYLQIDNELNLEEIDLDDETNQKLVVKSLLREKGFSEKQIDKKISKYIDAGLLEDEAEDAIEDLKEIKQQQKEQLLAQQKRAYEQYQQQQLDFCNNVVDEIKNLKNIRGIAIPDKDKRVLIDYILKPESDGKTKYQKDYAKGGVRNLIESAYFTMNADKLIEAAKKEGNNSAINKFKNSLRNSTINTKSKNSSYNKSNDDTIWDSFTRKLRIS